MVTDEQVKLLRQKRMEGKTQETAAATAGMSVRTARTWEGGPLPSQTKKKRPWRTHQDHFSSVWESDVVPLLEQDKEGKLQAKTVMAELQRRQPERFSMRHLRTLQRRIRDWRALNGPEKEVFFEQVHPPGREAAFDFTNCNELGVSIAGVAFLHLLFVLRLSFSKWTWIGLAHSETYEALVFGLQGALWELGGVPDVVRHDNLSAATHELRRTGGRSLNKRFSDVLDHYNLQSTRIKPGKSNENGGAEKNNHLVKQSIEQALLLRGHRDFPTTQHYLDFARDVVAKRDLSVDARLLIERRTSRHFQQRPFPTTRSSLLKFADGARSE